MSWQRRPAPHLCACRKEAAAQHSPRVSLKRAQAGVLHHTPQLQQLVTGAAHHHLEEETQDTCVTHTIRSGRTGPGLHPCVSQRLTVRDAPDPS